MCFFANCCCKNKKFEHKINGFFQKLTHLPAPIAGSA